MGKSILVVQCSFRSDHVVVKGGDPTMQNGSPTNLFILSWDQQIRNVIMSHSYYL